MKKLYLNDGYDCLVISPVRNEVQAEAEKLIADGWKQLNDIGTVKTVNGGSTFVANLIKWSQFPEKRVALSN